MNPENVADIQETFLRSMWISRDFSNQSWHLFRGELQCWGFSNNTSRWVWFKMIHSKQMQVFNNIMFYVCNKLYVCGSIAAPREDGKIRI